MQNLYEALVSLPYVDWYLEGWVTVVTPEGKTDIVRRGPDTYTIGSDYYTFNEIMDLYSNQTILDVIIQR